MTTRVKKKVTRKKATKASIKKSDKPHDPIEFAKSNIGRPAEYKPEFCNIVIEQMQKGYSKEATAGAIGISKQTFYRWMKEYKDFSDAVQIGEVLSQQTWEGKAVDYSVHTKDGKRLDSRIYALQMKNRFGWTDKKEINVGEETRKTFNFKLDVTPEELK